MDIPLRKDTTSTFIDNMTLPIHRWFRYTAGFSAQWVEETVTAFLPKTFRNNHFKVLDPFAGSGTTLLSCDKLGVASYGYESHPLIYKIADSKLLWVAEAESFHKEASRILELARKDSSFRDEYPDIVLKCYDEKNLTEIDRLRRVLNDYADATRLELSVLGEINSWGELQSKIRPGLVRSCSQMVSKEKKIHFVIWKTLCSVQYMMKYWMSAKN